MVCLSQECGLVDGGADKGSSKIFLALINFESSSIFSPASFVKQAQEELERQSALQEWCASHFCNLKGF